MGMVYEKKRSNLDLILQTIGHDPNRSIQLSEDGSFDGKPVLLWLESTSRCNLRCAKCGHGYEPPGTDRILPRNLADAVVDEADEYFAAAVKVRTSGYGEMFMFSRFRQLVERIKKHECWAEGTTNGVLIDPSEIDWLVELGYDQLVFSIDGASTETMKRVRGADVEKIWKILEYIKRKKEEHNTSKPLIVVGFVGQADNMEELPALARKLAVLNVSFLAVNTLHYKKYVAGTDDPYGRLYHEQSLARLERERVEALIEEARLIAEQANIGYGVYIDLDRVYRESAEDTAVDAGNFDAELISISPQENSVPAPRKAPNEALEPFYCVYPWTSMYVTARGSTSVCCSMRGDIGTVLNSGDLDRVWNGDTLRSIRQSIARGEVHPNCSYCVSRNRHLSSFVDLDSVRAVLDSQRDAETSRLAGVQPVPALPIFGYFDTAELKARSLDRVRISGWIASSQNGAPIQEFRLRLQGQELGVIRTFHPRPDVAAHYGRKDLLNCGWHIVVNLPALQPGNYELLGEATDPDGISGILGPVPVSISE